MAYGNWDDCLNEYQNFTIYSRFEVHAQSMIDLIPHIRHLPQFADVIPVTSHATLCLKLSIIRTEICIWGEQDRKYSVSLYDYSIGAYGKSSDEIIVDGESIIPTLVEYLEKLKKL
ncbi:MAG: hypothetical protein HZC41_01580 [Chloroflexi bacterium]|nr:hypothetical protein [Chloroflexota bacterium]